MPANRIATGLCCAAVEPLEPRQLLAIVPIKVTAHVFNDLNLNKRYDRGEPALRDVNVRVTYRARPSAQPLAREFRTDANGVVAVKHYFDDQSSDRTVPVWVDRGQRWQTTHERDHVSLRVNGPTAKGSIGLADRGPYTGVVRNVFTYRDGSKHSVPLGGRRVFEDRDGDARFDRGEPSAVTDGDGVYSIALSAGPHRLRVQPRVGWAPATPGSDVADVVNSTTPTHVTSVMRVRMRSPTYVDVVALYTSDFRNGQPRSQVNQHVADLFVKANRVFANSDTNVVINPVRIDATGYVESPSLRTDLNRFKTPGDGHIDEVHRLRDSLKADLAMLLVDRTGGVYPGKEVGLAYQYHAHPQQHTLGFSVVGITGLTGGGDEDWMTLAHEIGHNLGAGHAAGADEGAPTAPYARGYVLRHASGGHYKDVMSHTQRADGATLPFFSSPRIETHFGMIFGEAATADNARVVREVAPVVAKYR